MGYFTFKGIDSRTYGILEHMPMPPKAERTSVTKTIPGRAEPLISAQADYKPITITVTLGIKDKSLIPQIYSWLSGNGDLILSNDTSRKYKAYCHGTLVPEYQSVRFGKIAVSFVCQPFAYAVSNEPVTISSAQTIEVGGTVFCEPIYKIYGTGDGVLTVNGTSSPLTLTSMDEYIIVDCARKIAYKGTTVLVNMTSGPFPLLAPGNNLIQFSGGITSIEITKNERWF